MRQARRMQFSKNYRFIPLFFSSLIPFSFLSAADVCPLLQGLICGSSNEIVATDPNNGKPSTAPADLLSYPLASLQNPPQTYQIRVRNLEGTGVGFNKGYSSIDTFIPISGHSDKVMGFIDARGHIFNDGKWAANGGLGIRFLPTNQSWIYGLNAFYDFRQTNHSNFQQIGAGLEFLGPIFECRLNGYFPVGDHKHTYEDKFNGFKNHYAYFIKKFDFPFIGGDIEFGSKLYRGKNFSLDATLIGYYFSGKYGQNAGGGLANLKANITPYISISGNISYDSLFHCRGNGELSLNIPLGQRKKLKQTYLTDNQKLYLSERFLEPVGRFEIIVANNHKKKAKALDPVTGQPLFFVFVDNLRGSSDGSFENPYRTLTQAQANSSTGQVIYVFSGDGTTTGMNTGITLKNSQYFIGSSATFDVQSSFGRQTIPAQTINAPKIANTGADIVRLGNDNTVRGFQFMDGDIGINGQNSNNSTISHNFFAGPFTTAAIDITDSTGVSTVFQNNFIGGNSIKNTSTSTVNSVYITQNIFSGVGSLRIGTNLTGKIDAQIRNNAFYGHGITISPVGGIINGTIDQNSFEGNTFEALFCTSFSGVANFAITNNRINNVGTGVYFEVSGTGTAFWDFQGNEITNATSFGIRLENDSSGACQTYVKFVNNKSFATNQQGYFLENIQGGERFFIVADSIDGLASTNTGSIVGPNNPPNKVGPFTIPTTNVSYIPPGLVNP